jgi:anti-sigma factor RsiW
MLSAHPREELISALADGMLNVAETRRVAAHLRACPACQATLADFERNKALFAHLRKPTPPPEQFWNDAYRTIRTANNTSPGATVLDRFRFGQRQVRAGLAAAACLIAAILVPIANQSYGPGPRVTAANHTPVAEDTLDADDVSNFVSAHTESVASQPLSDPDRQHMLAAEVAMTGGEPISPNSGNADVSL